MVYLECLDCGRILPYGSGVTPDCCEMCSSDRIRVLSKEELTNRYSCSEDENEAEPEG